MIKTFFWREGYVIPAPLPNHGANPAILVQHGDSQVVCGVQWDLSLWPLRKRRVAFSVY